MRPQHTQPKFTLALLRIRNANSVGASVHHVDKQMLDEPFSMGALQMDVRVIVGAGGQSDGT
jgi:hypothetical protein